VFGTGTAALDQALRVLLYNRLPLLILVSLSTAFTFLLWRRAGWVARLLLVPAVGIAVIAAAFSWINPYEHMFHPLGAPHYVEAQQAAIDSNVMVIAVSLGGESRAYPIREMGYHHMVNDRLHQLPIVGAGGDLAVCVWNERVFLEGAGGLEDGVHVADEEELFAALAFAFRAWMFGDEIAGAVVWDCMGTQRTLKPRASNLGMRMSLTASTPAKCMVPLLISTSCWRRARSASVWASMEWTIWDSVADRGGTGTF
jgi:hypothetical protein